MIVFNDIEEINKILRKEIILQSGVPANRVRNALSTYGSELDKLLQNQEYVGACPCEELILFELKTRENDADVSMTEKDETITFDKSYTFYVIIYGNNSTNVANAIIARMRTQVLRQSLFEQGIYIEEVKNDMSFNEFKNEVMWHRHDFELLISCQLSITQISPSNAFESINPIQTILKGDEHNE